MIERERLSAESTSDIKEFSSREEIRLYLRVRLTLIPRIQNKRNTVSVVWYATELFCLTAGLLSLLFGLVSKARAPYTRLNSITILRECRRLRSQAPDARGSPIIVAPSRLESYLCDVRFRPVTAKGRHQCQFPVPNKIPHNLCIIAARYIADSGTGTRHEPCHAEEHAYLAAPATSLPRTALPLDCS